MSEFKNFQFNRVFLISGLIMFLLGLLAPVLSPYAAAQIGLLQAHLIGAVQGLVFFAFAWMWPQLSLPRFSKKLATVCLYVSLWANWIGVFLVGILGSGKKAYIVHQELVPGTLGFSNHLTMFLFNLSHFAVVAVLLAILGLLNISYNKSKEKSVNVFAVILFIVLLISTITIL